MSSQSNEDADHIGIREQIDWSNDCKEIGVLAKSADADVRREEYEKAHQKLTELSDLLEETREEYPRYIHNENGQETDQ